MFTIIMIFISAIAILISPIYEFITKKNSYEDDIETYILGNNPKDIGDVERLATEYVGKLQRNGLL